MDPECSLLFSQKPAMGSYPESNSIYSFTPYLSTIDFNIFLPYTLRALEWYIC
jgi:hypothetical protein